MLETLICGGCRPRLHLQTLVVSMWSSWSWMEKQPVRKRQYHSKNERSRKSQYRPRGLKNGEKKRFVLSSYMLLFLILIQKWIFMSGWRPGCHWGGGQIDHSNISMWSNEKKLAGKNDVLLARDGTNLGFTLAIPRLFSVFRGSREVTVPGTFVAWLQHTGWEVTSLDESTMLLWPRPLWSGVGLYRNALGLWCENCHGNVPE